MNKNVSSGNSLEKAPTDDLKLKLEAAGISYEDWYNDAVLSTLNLMDDLEAEEMSVPRRLWRAVVKGSIVFGKTVKKIVLWLQEKRRERKKEKQSQIIPSAEEVKEAKTAPKVDEDIKSVIKTSIQLATQEAEEERAALMRYREEVEHNYQKRTETKTIVKNAYLLRQIKANNAAGGRSLGHSRLSGTIIFVLIVLTSYLLAKHPPVFITNLLS